MTLGASDTAMTPLSSQSTEYLLPSGALLNNRLGTTSSPASLPRPNPSLSNRGLVIVQVQNNDSRRLPAATGDDVNIVAEKQHEGNGYQNHHRLLPVYDSVVKGSVPQCGDEILPQQQQVQVQHVFDDETVIVVPSCENGGGIAGPNHPYLHVAHDVQKQSRRRPSNSTGPTIAREDILSSATHQLIHGFPPFHPEVGVSGHSGDYEEDEEEEEEEEEEDVDEEEIDDDFDDPDYSPPIVEDQDEGYRTHSSSSGSPPSSVHSVSSPSPRGVECKSGSNKRPRESAGEHSGTISGGREPEEEGNLMWLVDFKLDFFNDIEKNGEKERELRMDLSNNPHTTQLPAPLPAANSSLLPPTLQTSTLPPTAVMDPRQHVETPPLAISSRPPLTLASVPISTSFPTSPCMGNPSRSDAKPNYTYTDLITLALKDRKSLTVSGIYQWITENYPYFKADDDRWKNSVRHNLSMNPHFRKGTKSKQGAGHVWVLADEGSDTLGLVGPNGGPLKLISNEDEAAEAVRNILGSSSVAVSATAAIESDRKRGKKTGNQQAQLSARGQTGNGGHTQQQQQQQHIHHHSESQMQHHHQQQHHNNHQQQQQRMVVVDPLQKCAEEILAGVKRPTGVEGNIVHFLIPDKHTDSNMDCPPAKRIQLETYDTRATSDLIPLTSIPLNLSSGSVVNLTSVSGLTYHTVTSPSSSTSNTSPAINTYCTLEQLQPMSDPVYTCQYTDYSTLDYSDPDNLERALGIDFTGVVQRELIAK